MRPGEEHHCPHLFRVIGGEARRERGAEGVTHDDHARAAVRCGQCFEDRFEGCAVRREGRLHRTVCSGCAPAEAVDGYEVEFGAQVWVRQIVLERAPAAGRAVNEQQRERLGVAAADDVNGAIRCTAPAVAQALSGIDVRLEVEARQRAATACREQQRQECQVPPSGVHRPASASASEGQPNGAMPMRALCAQTTNST